MDPLSLIQEGYDIHVPEFRLPGQCLFRGSGRRRSRAQIDFFMRPGQNDLQEGQSMFGQPIDRTPSAYDSPLIIKQVLHTPFTGVPDEKYGERPVAMVVLKEEFKKIKIMASIKAFPMDSSTKTSFPSGVSRTKFFSSTIFPQGALRNSTNGKCTSSRLHAGVFQDGRGMEKENKRIEIPKIEGYSCFGCGTRNPIGLNMSFYCLGNTVRSDLSLKDYHVGWENLAHGGMISTVLDEIMAWTVIAFERVFFVTRSIEVRYLRPVSVNVPLTAVGEIKSVSPPKGCSVQGALLDAEGVKLATAWAEMTYIPEKRLSMLPEGYTRDMTELFGKIERLLA
jgi:acyl-coenzyme A thioesterase PaaI-like protein